MKKETGTALGKQRGRQRFADPAAIELASGLL